jgi:hypothetical protein
MKLINFVPKLSGRRCERCDERHIKQRRKYREIAPNANRAIPITQKIDIEHPVFYDVSLNYNNFLKRDLLERAEKLLQAFWDRPFTHKEATLILCQSRWGMKELCRAKVLKQISKRKRTTIPQPSTYQFLPAFIDWYRRRNPC